jgi:uncharacterized protein
VDRRAWKEIGKKMRSPTLEAIQLLNIWAKYILGKFARPKDKTSDTIFEREQKDPQIIPLFTSSKKAKPKDNLPSLSVWQKLKSAKLIRLPAYKGDAEEQYNLGKLYCSIESYKLAFHWHRLAAMQGHVSAQVVLGMFYDRGAEGVEKNYVEAAKWFKRAAEQGDASGQYRFSRMLMLGRGIERNFKDGCKWCKLAAEQGVAFAQNFIGEAYFYGDWSINVKQNFQEAIRWWKLAADQGDSMAQFNLGLVHHKGGVVGRGQQNEFEWRKISDQERTAEKQIDLWLGDNTNDGVAQDFDEAVKWYQLAADQDNPNAQFNLGLMYLKGHGVSQDHEKGMDLIESASEHDHPAALYHLGLAYDLGDGVEPDDDYSNCNYEIAAEYGHSGARFGMNGDGSQNYRGN